MRRILTAGVLALGLVVAGAATATAAPAGDHDKDRVVCYHVPDGVDLDLGDLLHVDLDLGGLLGGDTVCVVVHDHPDNPGPIPPTDK